MTFNSVIYFQIFNGKMNLSKGFRVLVGVLGHQLIFKQILDLHGKSYVPQKTLPLISDFGVYSIVQEILCIDSLKNGFRIKFLKELRWPTLTTHKSKYFRSLALCSSWKLHLTFFTCIVIHCLYAHTYFKLGWKILYNFQQLICTFKKTDFYKGQCY